MGEKYMTPHQMAARNFSAKQIENGFHPEALHAYTDMQGNVLYWRIRLKHPNGTKWIRPMFKDSSGNFQIGERAHTTKPLYGLHRLALHPNAQVFIVEGEHPADLLNSFFEKQNINDKYIAITSGSATSADAADWQPLAKKHCIIWPDNDEPGENYAKQVLEKLAELECKLEIVDIKNLNLPNGGDCIDLLLANPFLTINKMLESCCPVLSEDENTLKKLSLLSPLEYDRTRISTANILGIRPATLDNMVKEEKAVRQKENNTPFVNIEPWHKSINPTELLNEIAATIRRFIVCQNETVTAATLWTAMTWFIDVIQVAPLAIITAPEKRCGKSQMLFLLSRMVNRPVAASNITPAALFRSIDAWQPTLLIDEADTFMRENEELRGLINCGHTRESAYIIRVVGDDHTPKTFFVWSAKALAGIGKLPDTIIDRSITLELRRKLSEEKVERLRHADPAIFKRISAKLARFSQDYSDKIRFAKPELPEVLNDRAQDNWEPLFAIAEIAGSDWMQLAQSAALKLSGEINQPQSMGVELLADIHEIYETQRVDRFSTIDLITSLCKDEEKPWITYNRGKPITPRQIASLLREFRIFSIQFAPVLSLRKDICTINLLIHSHVIFLKQA
jgi:5S rRNA maturation endonuclease (ribonuclease M5)